MVFTSVAELPATGSPSTRLFQTLVDGNSGQADVGGAAATGACRAPIAKSSANPALVNRLTCPLGRMRERQ